MVSVRPIHRSRSGPAPAVRGTLLLLLLAGAAPTALAHHPHDVIDTVAINPAWPADNTLFVTSDGSINLFLRSRNGGYSFQQTRSGLLGSRAYALEFAPDWEQSGILYVAQGPAGLQWSNNRGHTWEAPASDHEAYTVAVVPPGADGTRTLFYAARRGSVVRSDDGGRTTRRLDIPRLGQSNILSLGASPSFGTDRTVAVGLASGALHWSTDGGATWEQRVLPAGIQRILFSPRYAEDGTLWVATAGAGVQRSTDRGLTFQPCSDGMEETTVNDVVVSAGWPACQRMYCSTPVDGVYASDDGGRHWALTNLQVDRTFQTDNHYRHLRLSPNHPQDPTLVVGTYEGLFVTQDDARTWRKCNINPTRMGRKVAVSRSYAEDGTVFASGYGMQLIVSNDRGETWQRRCTDVFALSGYALAPSPDFREDQLVMLGVDRALRRSADGGRTWAQIEMLPHTLRERESSYEVRTIAYSPDFRRDRRVWAISKGGLFRSQDAGETWTSSPPLTPFASRLAISPAFPEDRTVFLAGHSLHRSVDGGETFTGALFESPVGGLICAPDFATSNEVYLVSHDIGFCYSTDRGDTWSTVKLDMGYHPSELAVSPDLATDGTIFVPTTGGGLFRSTDRGRTFARVGALGRPQDHVVSLDLSPDFARDQTLYVGTFEGIWRSQDAGETFQMVIETELYDDGRQPWIRYGNDWNRPKIPGSLTRGVSINQTPGARMVLPFTGKGIRVFGSKGPDHGIAEVLLDDELVAAVDCYDETLQSQVVLWEDMDIPWGYHALTVRVTGDNNERSRGRKVGVDGAEVAFRGPEEEVPVFARDVVLPEMGRSPPGSGAGRASGGGVGGAFGEGKGRFSWYWLLAPLVLLVAIRLLMRRGRC